MKKFKNQNITTKVAMFAGAMSLMALTPKIHAQSADALIDKLVDKGVLTVKEAQDLRDDADKNFTTAFQAKTGMPDWVTGYKFTGDFRGRMDEQLGGNQAFAERIQWRYRLRAGMVISMADNVEAGFRLGTSNGTGNPLSNNTTLAGNGTKKPIYVDTAYGKWTAVNAGEWMFSGTIGKMDNPFRLTPMIFDPDYTPEGVVLQGAYRPNDQQTLSVNGGAFVLNESATTSLDPYFYGGQVIWDSVWSPKIESSLGVAAFGIAHKENLGTAAAGLQDNNSGNTRSAGGLLLNNFNPVILDASATYKLDSFPFYTGMFPIKVSGEYIDNPAAPSQNTGYWAGVMVGKSGAKHTWDVTYRYEYLEADAWYEEVVDDDNGVIYGTGPAFLGGTNVKGHMLKVNYSITDALTFTFTCYINDMINQNISKAGTPGANIGSNATHFMADLMWKF